MNYLYLAASGSVVAGILLWFAVATELWQFVAAAGAGLGVVFLWLMFVYLPRRTGEDEPQEPAEKAAPQDHKGNSSS